MNHSSFIVTNKTLVIQVYVNFILLFGANIDLSIDDVI